MLEFLQGFKCMVLTAGPHEQSQGGLARVRPDCPSEFGNTEATPPLSEDVGVEIAVEPGGTDQVMDQCARTADAGHCGVVEGTLEVAAYVKYANGENGPPYLCWKTRAFCCCRAGTSCSRAGGRIHHSGLCSVFRLFFLFFFFILFFYVLFPEAAGGGEIGGLLLT